MQLLEWTEPFHCALQHNATRAVKFVSAISLPNQREAAEPATTNKRFDSNTQAPSWQPGEAARCVGKVIEDALRAAGLMR